MFKFSRLFLFRLLILVMAISPVQITMAIDFGHNNLVKNCQISKARTADFMERIMDEGCKSDQKNHCVDLSVCVTQHNFSSMKSSNSFLLLTRAVIHKKFIADSDAVSTQYPELLRRPPKV